MTSTTRNIGFLALTAVLGVGALFMVRSPLLGGGAVDVENFPIVIEKSEPTGALPPRLEIEGPGGVTPLRDPGALVKSGGSDRPALSTVIWPLVVELSLAIDGSVDVPEGAQFIGWGANAGIKGSVRGSSGRGAPSRVEFVYGPNEGRALQTDDRGRFGANDLFPGISVVRVTTGSSLSIEREVRLMGRTEREFHISFASPSFVSGTVKDEKGALVQGAEVRLDGKLQFTNDSGEFSFSNVPGGSAHVVVRKEGYAHTSQNMGIGYRQTVLPKNFIIFLKKGGELQISVNRTVGAVEPSLAYLMPASGPGRSSDGRGFPWHEINPVEIPAGGSAWVKGLPLETLSVRLFHRGAAARPASKVVRMHGGRPNAVAIDLVPAPVVRGLVTSENQPAPGATIQIEAADRARATSQSMQQKGPRFALSMVVPTVPSAYNETVANAEGQFTFTSPSELAATYYATATSQDGTRRGVGVVPPGALEVKIALEPISEKTGSLEIELPGRFQGLPVEVRLRGAPGEPYMLRSGEPLLVEDLTLGHWYVKARWRGSDVITRRVVVVEGKSKDEPATVRGTLPAGAIQGQTAAERDRAIAAEEITSGRYGAPPR